LISSHLQAGDGICASCALFTYMAGGVRLKRDGDKPALAQSERRFFPRSASASEGWFDGDGHSNYSTSFADRKK
jgi:hypothetical protein